MSDNRISHDWKAFPIFIVVLTLSMGCLCLPTSIIPTSAPTPTSAINATTINTPTVSPASVENETSRGREALNAEAPWLLIETDKGLWATNPDGSGLTQLADVDYWDANLQAAIQPGGNLIAFLTPADYDFHHMSLNLLSLPDGKIIKITDLTSPETEAYADSAPGDISDALRAVRDQHNLAWSPDGTRLAFVGLMDGPTADIYLYDTNSGKIQRLSQDDAQNYWPSWSPDGDTLLYFGTQAFGTGAGFDTSGVWLAHGDNMDSSLLYKPGGGKEILDGWLDNTTVVLNTWTAVSGDERLRLFDIISTSATMLSEEAILSAETDSFRGAVIFADARGLFLLTAKDRTPVQVSQEEVKRINPAVSGEYYFIVYFTDGSLATYGTSEEDHQVSPITSNSDNLNVSMYAWIWSWASDDEKQPGVWISGPGIEIGKIFDGRARFPIWDTDNNLLFFARESGGNYSLYHATFDAHYQDLSVTTSIDGYIRAVAWLGNQ